MVRFAAKLKFTIHPDTESLLKPLAPLLAAVSARLFDEILKLLLLVMVGKPFQLLRQYGLLLIIYCLYQSVHDHLAACHTAAGMPQTLRQIALGAPLDSLI